MLFSKAKKGVLTVVGNLCQYLCRYKRGTPPTAITWYYGITVDFAGKKNKGFAEGIKKQAPGGACLDRLSMA